MIENAPSQHREIVPATPETARTIDGGAFSKIFQFLKNSVFRRKLQKMRAVATGVYAAGGEPESGNHLA